MLSRSREAPVVDRASSADLAFLAMDVASVPEQFGVVLRLVPADSLDLSGVRRLVAARVCAVPRLRQRLRGTRLGCGGPVWVDDAHFDVCRHVREVTCAPPGDEPALLDAAMGLLTTRLPRDRPLWSVALLTGLDEGAAVLVVVVHHVLADGMGGMAILSALLDGQDPVVDARFPRPQPSAGQLAREALRRRGRALRSIGRSWRLLRESLRAGGGLKPARATPCSLLHPTGPRRRMAMVRVDHGALRAAAHRFGATTNDAVLVAVAAALRRVLASRGETVDPLVICVPVSGRPPVHPTQSHDSGQGLGNMVSPLIVAVPTTGEVPERLLTVSAQVRRHRASATGPPPIALLGWAFRPLARIGGFRWYMNHQHRLHTLVTHVRGPADRVTFGGIPVDSATAVAVGEAGNTPVNFGVLSYAGTLAVSMIVDPDHFFELAALTAALADELDAIGRLG